MASSNALKLVLYELNPRYFFDAENSGIGNLKGLTQKFDYFKFLKVDGIILQDVLSVDSKNPHQSFLSVAYEVGTAEQLARIFELGKKYRIKIYIELNIGSIKEVNKWFEKAALSGSELHGIVPFISAPPQEKSGEIEFVRSEKTQEFYPLDQTTREVPLNWHSPIVTDQFVKVISAWVQAGADGFALKNFEYIGIDAAAVVREPMTDKTQASLRTFLSAVRNLYPNTMLIGKTHMLEMPVIAKLAAQRDLFDYVYTTQASMLGTKDGAIDVVGKFKIGSLMQLIEELCQTPRTMFALGSSKAGRIASRWGSDAKYHAEAAKSLAAFALFSPASSVIYYGDEIGTKNLGLSYLDDFHDKSMELRRKSIVNGKYSEQAFMDAQVLQNPINARSLMAWNSTKNGGFSQADRTISALPDSYKQINVETEFNDKTSILHFYRNFITLVKDSPYTALFQKGEFAISFSPRGMVKATISDATSELVLLSNFSETPHKRVFSLLRGKILLSNYAQNVYLGGSLPKLMQPYETFVFVKRGPVHTLFAPLSAEELAKNKAANDQIKAAEAELLRKKVELIKVTAPLQTKTVLITPEDEVAPTTIAVQRQTKTTKLTPSTEDTRARARELALAWAKAQTRIVPQNVVSAIKPKTLQSQSEVKEATRHIISDFVADIKTVTAAYVQQAVEAAGEHKADLSKAEVQAVAVANIKEATRAISNDAVTKATEVASDIQAKLSPELQSAAAPVLSALVEHVRQATREITVEAIAEVNSATKELMRERTGSKTRTTALTSLQEVKQAATSIVHHEVDRVAVSVNEVVQEVEASATQVITKTKSLGSAVEAATKQLQSATRSAITEATKTVASELTTLSRQVAPELKAKTQVIKAEATAQFKTQVTKLMKAATQELKTATINEVANFKEEAAAEMTREKTITKSVTKTVTIPTMLTSLQEIKQAVTAIVQTEATSVADQLDEVVKQVEASAMQDSTKTTSLQSSTRQFKMATQAIVTEATKTVASELKELTSQVPVALKTKTQVIKTEATAQFKMQVAKLMEEFEQELAEAVNAEGAQSKTMTKTMTRTKTMELTRPSKLTTLQEIKQAATAIVQTEAERVADDFSQAVKEVEAHMPQEVASAKTAEVALQTATKELQIATRLIASEATKTVASELKELTSQVPAALKEKTALIQAEATAQFKTQVTKLIKEATQELKEVASEDTPLSEAADALRTELSAVMPEDKPTSVTAVREVTKAIIQTAIASATEATNEAFSSLVASHPATPEASAAQIKEATTAINAMVMSEAKAATRELEASLPEALQSKTKTIVQSVTPELKDALTDLQKQVLTQAKTIAKPIFGRRDNELTSKITAARRAAQQEDEAISRVSEDGPTKLRDDDVAKTTQVEVDDVDDIDAFLRELDRKKR